MKISYESIKKRKGLFLTILLSVSILFVLYGKVFNHLSLKYFCVEGDGLQSYYNALYHIKHDNNYFHTKVMNYPYPENVFFTNNLTVFSLPLQFVEKNLFHTGNTIVFIINFLMLISIVLGAIFLFLIFKELGVNEYYASAVSVGIAFFSPQIDRMLGHYTLSYVFLIPVTIYFIFRFYKNPTFRLSILFSIYLLVFGFLHLYTYAMSAALVLCFWFFIFILDKRFRNISFIAKHLALQIILPFLLIKIVLLLSDNVTDRTSFPWGFYECTSRWEGLFPKYKEIGLLKSTLHFNNASWEGAANVGTVAGTCIFFVYNIFAVIPFFNIHPNNFWFLFSIVLAGILIATFRNKLRKFYELTDNKILNILSWSALIILLVAYGYPFIINHNLLNNISFFRQFRAVGRFAFVFFYILNILVFYFLWKLKVHQFLRTAILFVALLLLYKDAWNNQKIYPEKFNNRVELLEDTQNNKKENRWIKNIDVKKYQAIVTFPYFHAGSENFWQDPKPSESFYYSAIFSLKTGLPLTSSMLSRTSISQVFNSCAMVQEPYRPLKMLDNLPNKKPFLVIAFNSEFLSEDETNLVKKCKLITKLEKFSIYEMPINILEINTNELAEKVAAELDTSSKYQVQNVLRKTPEFDFVYDNFDTKNSPVAYRGSGAYEGSLHQNNVIYDDYIPNAQEGKEYFISFWFNNYLKDCYSRSSLILEYMNGNREIVNTEYSNIFKCIKANDGEWALWEYKTKLSANIEYLRITLSNENFSKKTDFYLDDFSIRPTSSSFYFVGKNEVMKNSRYFSLQNSTEKRRIEMIAQNAKKVERNSYILTCDAEQLTPDKKSFITSDKNLCANNGDLQSSEKVFAGKYSVKLIKENPYGMTLILPNVKAGERITFSAWRYPAESDANLVVSAENNKGFYIAENKSTQNKENWGFVRLSFIVSEQLNHQSLKFYFWNTGNQAIYFDDMKIEKQY